MEMLGKDKARRAWQRIKTNIATLAHALSMAQCINYNLTGCSVRAMRQAGTGARFAAPASAAPPRGFTS